MFRSLDKHSEKIIDYRGLSPNVFENEDIAKNSPTLNNFIGTGNPRHLRALSALRVGPIPREQLDQIAGCSNGPALIAELRDLGLGKDGLLCTMVPRRDRDGVTIRRGVYSLSVIGCRAIDAWLQKIKGTVK